jgi:hypothetical protein
MASDSCLRARARSVLEMFDFEWWAHWFQSLDQSLLFLLILPFVVAIVGLWNYLSREGKPKSMRKN